MEIEILEIAKQEYDSAAEFYEVRQHGLGARFKSEIKQSLLRIKQFPQISPVDEHEIRKLSLLRFPYKIVYSLQNNVILVVAFAHMHRSPFYWVDRLD